MRLMTLSAFIIMTFIGCGGGGDSGGGSSAPATTTLAGVVFDSTSGDTGTNPGYSPVGSSVLIGQGNNAMYSCARTVTIDQQRGISCAKEVKIYLDSTGVVVSTKTYWFARSQDNSIYLIRKDLDSVITEPTPLMLDSIPNSQVMVNSTWVSAAGTSDETRVTILDANTQAPTTGQASCAFAKCVSTKGTTEASDDVTYYAWHKRGYGMVENTSDLINPTAGWYLGEDVDKGLKHYYRLNGNGNDIVGHKNGVASGSISYVNGFDGVNPGAISSPDAASIMTSSGTTLTKAATTTSANNTFSLSIWLRPLAIPSGFDEIYPFYRYTTSGGGNGFQLVINNTETYFRFKEAFSGWVGANAGTQLIANRYTHVVTIITPTVCRFYLDNVLKATSSYSNVGSTWGNSDLPLTIGSSQCIVDDVRVYGRVITDAEISTIYNKKLLSAVN